MGRFGLDYIRQSTPVQKSLSNQTWTAPDSQNSADSSASIRNESQEHGRVYADL